MIKNEFDVFGEEKAESKSDEFGLELNSESKKTEKNEFDGLLEVNDETEKNKSEDEFDVFGKDE